MKRILIAATAIAAFGFNTSAFAAESASANVSMGGTVANTCTLGTPAASLTTRATVTPGASNSTVVLSLADADTAELQASSFTLTYAGMCNYAHQVGIKATNGGLISTAPVSVVAGTFIRRIGYTSSIVWAGSTLTGPAPANSTTSATGDAATTSKLESSVAGANAGNLVLKVDVAAAATPVVAGAYGEALALKIGATI